MVGAQAHDSQSTVRGNDTDVGIFSHSAMQATLPTRMMWITRQPLALEQVHAQLRWIVQDAGQDRAISSLDEKPDCAGQLASCLGPRSRSMRDDYASSDPPSSSGRQPSSVRGMDWP